MKNIRIENVTKIYEGAGDDERAVDDVSLQVEAGELFFLLGSSGCGKTTLLRMIAGLTDPTAGRILLGGRDVTNVPANKRNTAMVFQNYALWPHMTVVRNVEFAPRMQGASRADRQAMTTRMLELVQMADYTNRKPVQLSGGQQQRVALARALAADPDCLLLDEPLSNLDARLRLQMRSELRKLVKDTGATAVYVTHDQTEALSMADRIAVMDGGRIHQTGAPQEVYNRPATRFVADFLGEGNFIEGEVAGSDGLADGAAAVDTPAGRLFARGENCPPVGDAVTCCIRPERLKVSHAAQPGAPAVAGPADTGEATAIAAEVVTVTFLGQTRQLTCRLAGGDVWRASMLTQDGGSGEFAPGQAVQLIAASQDVILLPAGDARSTPATSSESR